MNTELPELVTLYERHDASSAAWASGDRSGVLADPHISYEVHQAERVHYLAQEPVEYDVEHRPPMGTIVMDKDGDAWEFGRTRWSLLSPRVNKPLRVPGFSLPHAYEPYRVVGVRGRALRPPVWRYRLLRPHGVS